jgi:hypothetical protein
MLFPQSWASLVDRTALEGIPGKERKRQEVYNQIVSGLLYLNLNPGHFRAHRDGKRLREGLATNCRGELLLFR